METPETEHAFTIGDFNTQERSMAFARKLERERENWRMSSACREVDVLAHQLRDALYRFVKAFEDGPENCSYRRYEEVNDQAIAALETFRQKHEQTTESQLLTRHNL